MTSIEVLVPNFCQLGEGPHWSDDEQCLYYIDILGRKICRYDPQTSEHKVIQLEGEENVSLIVPIEGSSHEFVITRNRDLCKLFWNADQDGEKYKVEKLLSVEDERPFNRFNDGKCDSRGRLWAGTMGKEVRPGQVEPKMGSVFRIEATTDERKHLSAEKLIKNVDISNGLCWSKDSSLMYYIDTLTMSVEVFDFDDVTGSVSNRRTLFSFEKNQVKGFPDGMTIDVNGHLWVACFGSGQVIEIDPRNNEDNAGQLISTIKFPAKSITSVAFGGPKLTDLFVTSAIWGDESGSAGAGSLFRVAGAAQGLPANKFVEK